jgi:hypothetical protein
MKLTIFLCVFFILKAQSKFVTKEELHQIKKGVTFLVKSEKFQWELNFDIWQNEFLLTNDSLNKNFKQFDDVFLFIKENYHIPFVLLEEVKTENSQTNIFLLDWISEKLKKLIKRKIIL